MDIATLPNEMFSNVLKYTNFGRLMKLRKINQRIDNLAKRKKLCETVPVESFQLLYKHEFSEFETLNIFVNCEYYGPKGFSFILQPNTEIASVLQFYLPKMTVKNHINIAGFDINEEAMQVMYNHRESLSRVTGLCFVTTNFNIGEDLSKRFYSEIFPNVNAITLNGDGYEEIFNSEVLADRNLDYLKLFKSKVNYILDDNFLSKVIVNCESVDIDCENITTFTVIGVQQLLKDCLAADGTFIRDFNLGAVYGLDVPLDNLQEMFDKIIKEELKDREDGGGALKCSLKVYETGIPHCRRTWSVTPISATEFTTEDIQMDLSTLPNEMFSNVLKYTNFGRLMKLRKINQRIDELAKRNKLCERIPVNTFLLMCTEDSVSESGTHELVIYVDDEYYENFEFILQPTVDFSTVLKFYLPKVTINGDFNIHAVEINEQVMDVLYKNRASLNRVTRLTFVNTTFKIGKDLARRFYGDIFPNVYVITLNGDGGQEIFNSEVLADRKWSYLKLFENESDVNYVLDDNFLIKVVANFREVQIHCWNTITFTLTGVQHLLKACIAADGTFRNDYSLGLVYGLEVPLDDLSNIFDKIIEEGLHGNKDIYGNPLKCRLTVVLAGPIPLCKFTFEDGMDAPYLRFFYEAEMFPP